MAQLIGIVAKRAGLTDSERAQKTPVHLLVDESQNYCTPSIKEILDEARKFRLHLTLANQYIGQFSDPVIRASVEQNTMIKVVGLQPSDRTKTAMAKTCGTDAQTLGVLGQGKFFVKIGELPGFLIQNGSHLVDDRHAMTPEEWQTIRTQQLKRYYRSVEDLSQALDGPHDDRQRDQSQTSDHNETTDRPNEYESMSSSEWPSGEEEVAEQNHPSQRLGSNGPKFPLN